LSTRLELVEENEDQPAEELSPAVEGLLACIETGLAHLSPEQQRLYDNDAEPNMLVTPPAGPDERNSPTAEY
jgi:hypothetical protein